MNHDSNILYKEHITSYSNQFLEGKLDTVIQSIINNIFQPGFLTKHIQVCLIGGGI